MTNTKSIDIQLRQAEAKFTRSKAALDGTAKTEAAYQKAKKNLSDIRREWRRQGRPRPKPGDANAAAKTLTVKSKAKKG